MSWCAGFSPAFYEAYWSVIKKDEGGFEEKSYVPVVSHLESLQHVGGGYRRKLWGC